MPENPSVLEILKGLELADFDSLIGVIETLELDAKGSPYRLSEEWQKHELAKDVSALANARGGIILIGFRTSKDNLLAVERVDECRPFALENVDVEQYRKVLEEWVYPPVHAVRIECYRSPSDKTRGVAAIFVPASATDGKPYVVTKTVQPDGITRGTLIGYYERVQDRIPATSSEMIRAQLRDGLRFQELSQRLESLESILGALSAPTRVSEVGISVAEIDARIHRALVAVQREQSPSIILAAASSNPTVFPKLFHSDSEIVKILEHPPQFRPHGFGVRIEEHSEIVKGELRRTLRPGSQILELWKDGLFVAVGEGDDDLLCWWAGRRMRKGLPIRNFVLAEVVLNFLHLAADIFHQANPEPKELRFSLTLNQMTEDGVPCTLSTIPDNRERAGFGSREQSAPTDPVSSQATVAFKQIDLGMVAYELLGGLYTSRIQLQ